MPENLLRALSQVRARLLDPDTLVRAVASGRQKAAEPRWRRVELRYVDLKAGRHLQVTAYDETQAHTSNHPAGDAARDAVDDLLDEPFGNWHVEGTEDTLQLRVTRKGALMHTSTRTAPVDVDRGHDRDKDRLLPEDDPLFRALGLADAEGRLKPSRRDKYRQVEEFLRLLDTAVTEAIDKGQLRRPTPEQPLRVADLGCGNAYLTFAAFRYLTEVRGLPVEGVGVDVKAQSRAFSTDVARQLGIGDRLGFVEGTIGAAEVPWHPDLVMALHACDTATDDALARAVDWEAPVIVAAPCCHHDLQRQLDAAEVPEEYRLVTRHGILRERLADVLTDTFRAAILRLLGYRVEVIEFVDSRHTPRNALIRAVRTGAAPDEATKAAYRSLVQSWHVQPALADRLADRLADQLGEAV